LPAGNKVHIHLPTQSKPEVVMRVAIVSALSMLLACAGEPSPKRPLTQQREIEGLLKVAAWPGADDVVVVTAMQQLAAAHREWEGYEFFGRLAGEQPARRALFRSLQAVLQARVAGQVPLLKRAAWVEDAIARLDEGAAAVPLLGRLLRGLTLAELPPRFGRTAQAIEDLQACLAERERFPIHIDRGIYRALAKAFHTLGDDGRSREMLSRAGSESLDGPAFSTNLSVDARGGFRFDEPRFVSEGEGVYVAEGYDFGNLAFIVGREFVVAIDAGTTERTARAAVEQLRRITRLPIKYVILTHGHWDHVGGLAAVREPGSVVVAQAAFSSELELSRSYHPPFRYFFGDGEIALTVKPDRLVRERETLRDGDVELDLIPVHGGETDDGLFIHHKKSGLLFVGDAFMPYVGAPFVAEGSPRGYLESISAVEALHPRRLIHGHSPLTQLFTLQALPGLGAALGELYQRTVAAAHEARPIADVLHDNFVPESLRAAPKAVLPYLVIRDNFVQRIYRQQAGYWASNGDGMDHFTREEQAAALDLLAGGAESAFARAADELIARGDAAMALRLLDLGLARHPDSEALRGGRSRALTQLRERYSQMSPFRFIIYSEWTGQGLAPVQTAAQPSAQQARSTTR
jgi:glyoxylase-like metal-dependent hydrolase (beta-lactamase superfamily II)